MAPSAAVGSQTPPLNAAPAHSAMILGFPQLINVNLDGTFKPWCAFVSYTQLKEML